MAYADNTTGGRRIVQGYLPVEITLGEACEVGDLLGYSSGWKRALATAGSVIHPRLVAGQRGKSGDVITAYAGAIVKGVSGATGGNYVYTAEAALYGETTETAPSTTNDLNAPMGFSIDDDTILLLPAARGIVYHDADHLAA
jgi:hypothetical protein